MFILSTDDVLYFNHHCYQEWQGTKKKGSRDVDVSWAAEYYYFRSFFILFKLTLYYLSFSDV
jgi:hypothetical protein